MSHGGIGNRTNTLIETGARHMQQCRTSYDVLVAMSEGEEELLANDDKWCMAKDELVVSCGKNLTPGAAITGSKYAYPSVITTLGTMNENEKIFIASYYHFLGRNDVMKDIVAKLFNPTEGSGKIKQYRHFTPVGYSVGRACAHAHKGDTIAAVQIGGLRTVINGAFEVQTGDIIQMYMPDAESGMFDADGGRLISNNINEIGVKLGVPDTKGLGGDGMHRRDFYNRGLGVKQSGTTRVKQGMFSIKPYLESKNEDAIQYYGDRVRVFAKALSSARPFEPVDIMIARQSL